MIKTDPRSVTENRFLNIPYRLGGKDFDGCDCVGLCVLFLKENGLDYEYDMDKLPALKHWWQYAPSNFMNFILQYGSVIPFNEIQKFDVVMFFGDDVHRFPSLMTVMVDDRHFLSIVHGETSRVKMLSIEDRDVFWGAIRLHKISERNS